MIGYGRGTPARVAARRELLALGDPDADLAPGQFHNIYLSILIPHIILAVVMLPLIFVTFRRALAGRFDDHKRIARPTLAIWMYVSITGVIVYLMLYHMPKG